MPTGFRTGPGRAAALALLAAMALLLAAGTAASQGVSKVVEAADRALAAAKKGDDAALRPLAEDPDVDAWLVADELCGRGEHDAALRLAKAAPAPQRAKLPAYVESRRGKTRSPELRIALERSRAALAAGDAAAGAAALEGVPVDGTEIAAAGVHLTRAYRLHELGRLEEASREFAACADIAGRLGWDVRAAYGFQAAAAVAFTASRPAEARSYWEKAIPHERFLGNRKGEADAMANIAWCREALGDLQGALEEFEKVQEFLKAGGDAAGDPGTWINMGNLLLRLGRTEKARGVFEKARDAARTLKDGRSEGGALVSIARALAQVGDLPGAMAANEAAFPILESAGAEEELRAALMNQGNYVLMTGDLKRTLRYYERAAVLSEKLGETRDVPLYSNLADVHEALGNQALADEYRAKALGAAREIGDRYGIGLILLSQAATLAKRGRLPEALKGGEEALAAFRAQQDRRGLAMAVYRVADLRSQALDNPGAIALYEESLVLAGESGDRNILVGATAGMAGCLWQAGRHAEARQWARRAVEGLADLFRGLGDVEAARIRERAARTFEVGIAASLVTGATEDFAFFLESGRAGALLEGLGSRDRVEGLALSPALLAARGAALAAEAAADLRLQEARGSGDLKAVGAARKALDSARAATSEVVDRIQREAKMAAAVLYPRAASLAEIQACLLPGEALVVYGDAGGKAVALVATRDGARALKLAPLKEVEAASAALALGTAGVDAGDRIAALRRLVVEPLGLDASVRRVLVSPAGPLAAVPFAALLPDREIAYVPSGTALRLLRDAPPPRGKGVLAFGDPDYAAPGPGGSGTRSGPPLAALPASRLEARAVGTAVLVGKEATETALRARLSEKGKGRWRAVHLACHGILEPSDPTRSALALAADGGNDGMLTVLDVFGLGAPADLVVLSACETARGREFVSEGVMGFPRAFLLAGAPRVLVSLWKVDDEATRALMTRFYEAWDPKDGKGIPAAEALRKAQDSVRGQKKWEHPAFWAAWQLWGLGE